MKKWRRSFYTILILVDYPAGGNQRDLARAKNAKKAADQDRGKRNDDGLSLEQRKQRLISGMSRREREWI